jgi:hypothetical protein
VGDNEALDERASELIALAIEQGFPYWRAPGTAYRGWVTVKNGDVREGISLLRIGSVAYRATGSEAWTPQIIALLATACDIAGQFEEALTLLDWKILAVDTTRSTDAVASPTTSCATASAAHIAALAISSKRWRSSGSTAAISSATSISS